MEVSSEEEVYLEEDVCSYPVVPFKGMEFDSIEEKSLQCLCNEDEV
jgi:hypothetical protein